MSTETTGKRTRPSIPGDREHACVRAMAMGIAAGIPVGMHP